MAHHRGARVACAAQGAGRYRLHSVKELEKTADEKQSARGANYGRLGRINPGDVLRRRKKKYGHYSHEAGGEKQGGPPGPASAIRIAPPERLSYANCGSRAESQGNHVRKAHSVERDLMAG